MYSCDSLAELYSRTQAGHCVSLALERRDASEFNRGDLVKIMAGSFETFHGRILEVDTATQSARADVEIFGPGPCLVPTADLAFIHEQ